MTITFFTIFTIRNTTKEIKFFSSESIRLTYNSTHSNASYNHLTATTTILDETDPIYDNMYISPIVIPEFNLIFFAIPKVACTEFKLLFRELLDMPWPFRNGTNPPYQYLHNPRTNNLTQLMDFSIQDAQYMMNSDEWTKAIFVREPKERILSAFLNKYADEGFRYYLKSCCRHSTFPISNETKRDCVERMKGRNKASKRRRSKEFSYFLNMTLVCKDGHWDPQYDYIDAKWWPKINFVGYMETIAADSQRLLKSLISNIHGNMTAWDKSGKTGWGDNNTDGFLQVNKAKHYTGASEKLKEFYTPEDEKFVEDHWSIEWNQGFFHYDLLKIYPET